MFFLNKDDVPQGVGFSTFDATHLLWLLGALISIVAASVIYRRLDDKRRTAMRTVVGVAVVMCEIIKDIVVAAVGDFGVEYLPFHLCGINILLIGFDLIKQTKTVRNFLYYIGIPGAMLALLFPNWTVLPCMNFFHIHSFVVHLLLVMYPVILVTSGEIKPDVRTMPKCLLLLVGLAIPAYILNVIFDTNFMFLMSPETGNPLGLFEQCLGSHLWGFPVLLPIVMFVMYLPLLIASKLKKQKEELTEPENEKVKA